MKLLLVILFFLCLFGCGVRKTQLEKSSSKESLSIQIKERLDSIDKSLKVTGKETLDQKDVTDEQQTEITVTKYKDGQIVEQTTTKTKGKFTDRGILKAAEQTKTQNDISVSTETDNRLETKNAQNNKSKSTEADKTVVANVGGKNVLIIIVIIVVTALFLYFWIKKK